MQAHQSVLKLRRILVPIDFSVATAQTLRYAAAYAQQYQATVTLLHVVKPDGSHHRRNISVARLIEELIEAGETQLRQLTRVFFDEVATDIVVATGKPYLQIVNETHETSADMIIMGNHGNVGSWGLFRRNTAGKVSRHAPCPVLVVRALDRGFVMERATEQSVDR